MKSTIGSLLAYQQVRFVLAGATNTATTLVIFWLLRRLFDLYVGSVLAYQGANAIAYIIGIVISYMFNTQFVFRTPMTLRTFLRFPLVYVVQYLLSASLLSVFIELFGIPPDFAPIIVVILLLPLTYILSKILLQVRPNEATPNNSSES